MSRSAHCNNVMFSVHQHNDAHLEFNTTTGQCAVKNTEPESLFTVK